MDLPLRLELDSATSPSPHQSSSPSSSSSRSMTSAAASPDRLLVTNLSYSVLPTTSFLRSCSRQKHAPRPLELLNSVSFAAHSSEILAVVGPSGAGKSTLLRVISGRVDASKLPPSTVISFFGRAITNPAQMRKLCGFVTQEDNLLPLLTVKETLLFAAKLRLRNAGAREREEKVDALMRELRLGHVADSYVGDEENRSISGGERKRVAVAVDVIHDPPILLLDEPTSGLDSTSALQVVQLLASMARSRQQMLILTIHQPSYRILHYFSTFLLLSRGRVAHYGSLETLTHTILRLGFKVPAQINPLEFAMEITQQLEDHTAKLGAINNELLNQERLPIAQDIDRDSRYCSRLDEMKTLSWRFWKVIYRTKQLFLARTMQAVVGGLGLGSVYLRVKPDKDGVAERLGFFAFTLSFLLSSTVEALPIFLQERRVLMRESSRGMYRLSSYVTANAMVFSPFLLVVALLFAAPVYWLVGLNPSIAAFLFFVLVVWMIVLMASSLVLFLSAISPNFILGNSLICLFLGVFFLFSGYFIPKDSIPKYWIFMYYVSPYRYPLDALLINEYWSVRDECFAWHGSVCSLTGEDVLRTRGLEKDTRWMNMGIMFSFFLGYRLLCWIMLLRRASTTRL